MEFYQKCRVELAHKLLDNAFVINGWLARWFELLFHLDWPQAVNVAPATDFTDPAAAGATPLPPMMMESESAALSKKSFIIQASSFPYLRLNECEKHVRVCSTLPKFIVFTETLGASRNN